jgi:hypothetical protein
MESLLQNYPSVPPAIPKYSYPIVIFLRYCRKLSTFLSIIFFLALLLFISALAQAQEIDSVEIMQRLRPLKKLPPMQRVAAPDSLAAQDSVWIVRERIELDQLPGQKTKLLYELTPPTPPTTVTHFVDTIFVRNKKRDLAPRVFVDCNRCDHAFIRQEINFVNHVRDPKQAQVHVLIVDQPTGSGGRNFTLAFIGQENFVGTNHTLTYTSVQNNTAHEERVGLNRILRLGLVLYAAQTPLADQLTVTFKETATAEQLPVEDPWNNWVFDVYGSGNFSKEALQSSLNLRYGAHANRVTEQWKIRNMLYFNQNSRTFTRGEEVISRRLDRNGLSSSVVRSITDHWSAGAFGNIYTNNFENIQSAVRLTPAIEYSFFPYQEAQRKEITLVYRAGYNRLHYFEETVFGQTEETLYNQALQLSVRLRQPWGSVFTQLSGSHFLHDMAKRRIELNTSANLRLVKGLALNFSGNFNIINDQLFLPRRGASLEDILLQQQRLATDYYIYASMGFTYTFGSIYNNIVNPRM